MVSAGDTVHTFNIADEETADRSLTLTLDDDTYYDVVNNGDGTATVTLNEDGVAYLNAGNSLPQYTVTVTDGDGATATETQTPDVSLVNDAPVADAESNTVTEDNILTVNDGRADVLDGDTDAEGDDLTVSGIRTGRESGSGTSGTIGQSLTGTYGNLTINSDGTYTYTPGETLGDGETGTDYFTYTVSDGNGGTDTAELEIVVTGVNDAPTASDTSVTMIEDENHVFEVNDFGFTDVDSNDSLDSITITSLENSGSLQYYDGSEWKDVSLNQVITASDIADGYLRFVPGSGESGNAYDNFEFTVNDGTTDSSSSYKMVLNVTGVNDAPRADNENNVSATEDTPTRVTDRSDGVLDGDTDADNDTLTVSGIRTGTENGRGTSGTVGDDLTGTYGTLKINRDGTYTYIPNDILSDGQRARDYFTYTVSDGNGGTDTAQLSFLVTGVNDNPVARNDSNTIDISTTTALRVTNGSVKDALTNDSDVDQRDRITISEVRTGATEGAGTAGTIGRGLAGTYGTLTLNSNGSYTYTVDAGLKDTLDPGQIVFDYFNYTLADDNSGTDTGSIIIKVQNGGAIVNEIKEKRAEKKIEKRVKKETKIALRQLNVEGDGESELSLNKFEFENTKRKTEFSQGLKLVDLVAETESIEVSDGTLLKVNAKEKSDTLKLNFKVMNETDNEIIKFEGKMADGSDLPSWIKVDAETGKTSTTIPDGVDKLDIVIIATDKNNETREVTVEIDPEQIKKDRQVVKAAKRVNALISVGTDGNINLVRQKADGTIDTIPTQNLNFNNQTDIKDIIEAFKPERTFQLRAINTGPDLTVSLPTEVLGSFQRTKLVLKDGSEVPSWLDYDPNTGQIIAADPPEDLSLLELKLIIERDGEIIVRDLEIDLGNADTTEIIDPVEDNKFVAFNDQLEEEFNDWDDYGNNVINRL